MASHPKTFNSYGQRSVGMAQKWFENKVEEFGVEEGQSYNDFDTILKLLKLKLICS